MRGRIVNRVARQALARPVSRGYSAVALVRPKSADNYGTAMRSCVVFGVDLVQIVCGRFRRQSSDTVRSWAKVPVLHQQADLVIPYDCVPVAVELVPDATPLPAFVHPERALYVFGPEDGNLPPGVLARCARKVAIPGAFCLNLASAVSIVLYDRAAKRGGLVVPAAMIGRKAAAACAGGSDA